MTIVFYTNNTERKIVGYEADYSCGLQEKSDNFSIWYVEENAKRLQMP